MRMNLEEEIQKNKEIRKEILPIMYSYKNKRDDVITEEEKDKLTEELRDIKKRAINNIEEIKKETIMNLEKNGIKVIEVKDKKEAEKVLKEIIGDEKNIIKSKSNASNEIELEKILQDKELIETDLGDFLVKLCDKKDLHPVLPAIHLTPEKIVKVIKEKLGEEIKPTPEEITSFVRGYLREKIFKSKIGITGANVISKEGSVFILENEGNISLASRIPDKHIIISSFDKIVESREDALKITRAAAIFGTGQEYTVYVNIISGPSKTADIQNKLIFGAQGTKEVYLILLDNNRSKILNSKFKEILYCINCGACMNFCPVYHQIFTLYGSDKFPGSKGVICSYFDKGSKKAFENGGFFCTTCKMCKQNCPMGIDLSEMMKELREFLAEEGCEPENIEKMLENIKKYGNPFGEIDEDKIPDKLYCC
jgi:iron-sulfur cluster protein